MAYIAGHYFAFWSASVGSAGPAWTHIGSTRNGFRQRETIFKQPVVDDAGGESEVDAIQQGMNVFVEFDYIEYDLIRQAAGNGPLFGTGTQIVHGQPYANVGLTLSSIIGSLLLLPQTKAGSGGNTPTGAASADGTNSGREYYRAALVDDIDIILSSKLREGPLRFQCYPDPNNSYKTWDFVSNTTTSITFPPG